MKTQIFFVVLVFANQAAFWILYLSNRNKFYRWIGAAIAIGLPLLTVFFPQPRFELDYYWWKTTAPLVIILGGAIFLFGMRQLMKEGVPLLDKPQKLVISGLYRYFRHPQYLGLIFIFVGWWWLWAAIYSFYFGMLILASIWLQGYLEEKIILEKTFGSRFAEYQKQTGMFWIK